MRDFHKDDGRDEADRMPGAGIRPARPGSRRRDAASVRAADADAEDPCGLQGPGGADGEARQCLAQSAPGIKAGAK